MVTRCPNCPSTAQIRGAVAVVAVAVIAPSSLGLVTPVGRPFGYSHPHSYHLSVLPHSLNASAEDIAG